MPHPLAVSFIVVTKMSNVSNHAMFGVISADAPADAYRVKAAELNALSKDESYAALRAEFANLARAYLSLAEQAEQSSDLDIAYEAPPDGRRAPTGRLDRRYPWVLPHYHHHRVVYDRASLRWAA
jgi:hypothetical protein